LKFKNSFPRVFQISENTPTARSFRVLHVHPCKLCQGAIPIGHVDDALELLATTLSGDEPTWGRSEVIGYPKKIGIVNI